MSRLFLSMVSYNSHELFILSHSLFFLYLLLGDFQLPVFSFTKSFFCLVKSTVEDLLKSSVQSLYSLTLGFLFFLNGFYFFVKISHFVL